MVHVRLKSGEYVKDKRLTKIFKNTILVCNEHFINTFNNFGYYENTLIFIIGVKEPYDSVFGKLSRVYASNVSINFIDVCNKDKAIKQIIHYCIDHGYKNLDIINNVIYNIYNEKPINKDIVKFIHNDESNNGLNTVMFTLSFKNKIKRIIHDFYNRFK